MLKPIIANFDKIHEEPFRVSEPCDRQVVYNWRCSCRRGLTYGHCAHIFFMTHGKHTQSLGIVGEYENKSIPVTAVTENIGQKRKRGSPTSTRPALAR